jgi:tRNA nucleotidyltransferase (CCA-adding enzyme)
LTVPQEEELTRNVSRRLERLEANAKASAAFASREPHILCFVDMQRRVRSQVQWKNGKNVWTYFDEDGAIERVEEK